MCSIQLDENETVNLVETASTELKTDGKPCTKCGQPAVIALRIDDIYCRGCFMVRATHRFRCEFGKSRLIRDGESVLVAYSGGRNSCALIHLIQEGLSKRANKKLRFIPELVYIDDADERQNSESVQRREFLCDVLSRLQESGLKCHIFSLSQVFDDKLVPISHENTHGSLCGNEKLIQKLISFDRNKLQLLMKSTLTGTSQESIKSLLRIELLVRWARQMHFGKVIVGDCASRMASRLLSSIVQGRGAQIPCEMGFADDRHGDVTFLRPLREFTDKEIDMYNVISGIIPLASPKNGTQMTIQSLSKRFVSGLQEENSGTLAIICRTGEKLEKAADESIIKDDRCVMCQAPVARISSEGSASANDAMAFSQQICRTLRENNETAGTVSSNDASQMNTNSHSNETDPKSCTSAELLQCLCYGCKLTIREMTSVENLPSAILQKAKDKDRRESLYHNIEAFLLEDEHNDSH